VSLILNSSLQVAIALTPALVIISMLMGGGATDAGRDAAPGGCGGAVGDPGRVIVFDGESNWLEGLA